MKRNRKVQLLLIFAAILIVAANIIACGPGYECGYSDIEGLCATMEVIKAAGTAAAEQGGD